MPSQNERVRRQRIALFNEQNGMCFWCRRRMLLPPNGKFEPGAVPEDACTIDHLDEKGTPERGTRQGERRRVAACWRCNNQRGLAHAKFLHKQQKMACESVHGA